MALFFPQSNIIFTHFPKTGGCAFYSMLQELQVQHEDVGFQHDAVDMLGPRFWKNKPVKVFCLSREKESWFKSFHKWRSRNPEANVYAGVNENWHPVWILEDLFHPDFETFRDLVQFSYPKFYEHLQIRYFVHPTFRMNILPFEDFGKSYKTIFDAIGHEKELLYFEKYPRIN